MAVLTTLKHLVGVLAIVCFSFQMFFALQHFLADPTLTFVTRSSLSQLDKLIMVVICRTRQFDAEKASVFGYTSVAGYLTGQTGNVSDLTWSGKDGDVDPEDVLNKIFSLDTGNITLKNKMTAFSIL